MCHTTRKILPALLVLVFLSLGSSTQQAQSSCASPAGIPGLPGKPGDQGPAGRDGRDGINGLNGVQGQPGRDGVPGRDGAQGPLGLKGEGGPQGPVGPPGSGSTSANWKECVWKKEDGKDNGKIMDCMFVKKSSGTALRVYYGGNLRIYSCDRCCKRWYFTFNGTECSGPMAIDGVFYLLKGANAHEDLHRHRHIEGHCLNIPKGNVRVGFWVGNCHGYGNADASTGWNSVSRIYVEEVSPPQK